MKEYVEHTPAPRRRRPSSWWAATSALLIALALFLLSLWQLKSSGGGWLTFWGGVKAFAEAAMVGALADWFAVVALFRHPLGLPIPHTAVLVRGRERVAGAIGSFISGNFLTAEVLAPRLTSRRPAWHLGKWCARKGNPEKILSALSGMAPVMGRFLSSDSFRQFLRNNMIPVLRDFPLSQTVSIALERLGRTPAADNIIGRLSEEAVSFVEENRNALEAQVEENLPLPDLARIPILSRMQKLIAGMIAPLVVDKIHRYLEEVARTPSHPLRLRVREKISSIAVSLREDPGYAEAFERAKSSLMESETIDMIARHLAGGLKEGLGQSLLTPGSVAYGQAVGGIRRAGLALRRSREFQDTLDRTFVEFVTGAVERYHAQLEMEIKRVVLSWDTDSMVEKIEEQVGSDLQFIRLNGTIVGGMVGLLLFLITLLWN